MTITNAAPFDGRPSRRAVLAVTGLSGLALVAGSKGAFGAAADNVLRVGFVSPRTGALAGFGQTDGYVLDLARKALAGGLKVGDKTYDVQILDRDTQSDPSRASQLAKTLINSDGIDLMLAVSTPEVVNPVADACEGAGIPCLSTVVPWQAWYFGRGAKPGQPSPFKWTYHFGFGVGEFFQTYLSQWSLIETNKKVGVLYPNDADGNAIRAHLAPLLSPRKATRSSIPAPTRTARPTSPPRSRLFKKEKVRDLQHLPHSARFRRLLAPGRAAGLYAAGQDLPGRQDRPVPGRNRGPRRPRAQYLERRLLAQDLPLHVVAHGGRRGRTRGRLREGLGQAMDTAARGEPRAARCRPAGFEDQRRPEEERGGRQSPGGPQHRHDRGQGRFHQRPRPQRRVGADHRHAMGQGARRLALQARLCRDEHVTDPNVPIGGKLVAFNSK